MTKQVLKIDDWIVHKEPQFKMTISGLTVPGMAMRIIDKLLFGTGEYSSLSEIKYKGRHGIILEFMSDYVHVQIEVVFDDGVNDSYYETIEVPINDVEYIPKFYEINKKMMGHTFSQTKIYY